MTARNARPHPNLAGIESCTREGTSPSRTSQYGVPPFLLLCWGEFPVTRAPQHRHGEGQAPATPSRQAYTQGKRATGGSTKARRTPRSP